MNQVSFNTQFRDASRSHDYQSPDETVAPEDALSRHLIDEGTPGWFAEAGAHAVHNNDLPYLIREIARHVPGWVAA